MRRTRAQKVTFAKDSISRTLSDSHQFVATKAILTGTFGNLSVCAVTGLTQFLSCLRVHDFFFGSRFNTRDTLTPERETDCYIYKRREFLRSLALFLCHMRYRVNIFCCMVTVMLWVQKRTCIEQHLLSRRLLRRLDVTIKAAACSTLATITFRSTPCLRVQNWRKMSIATAETAIGG